MSCTAALVVGSGHTRDVAVANKALQSQTVIFESKLAQKRRIEATLEFQFYAAEFNGKLQFDGQSAIRKVST
jgi:hypothetical protein